MPFDLAPYDHVLLDMNGTFVFDFDRFGPEENFGETYARLNFSTLDPKLAHTYVRAAYDYMAVRYIDEDYYHRFPSVEEAVLATIPGPIAKEIVHELVMTFTAHELGVLPKGHKQALHQLAEMKPISVLSNLWAPKQPWLERFKSWGIHHLFSTTHFSSDGSHMKPHPMFFKRALSDIERQQPGARVLYVGDSFRCDVMGALASGLDAVWLSTSKEVKQVSGQPVEVFENLVDFVAACQIEELS